MSSGHRASRTVTSPDPSTSTERLLDQKVDALCAHASQTTPLRDLVGAETYREWWRTEYFVDVMTHRQLTQLDLIGATP